MEQMLLWEKPLTAEVLVRQELHELKDRQNNLRRGLFQRFDDLKREVIALREEVVELREKRIN